MFSSPANWPVVFVCAAMIAAAAIDWWKFKVPNWLTFPVILSGWLLGLVHTLGWHPDAGVGGLGDALLGTVLGFGVLIPMYAIGGMGAGDVKMTMGFGSWVGVFFGMAQGWEIILLGFCLGALAGGVIAVGMILLRRQFRDNLQHTRAILVDLMVSGNLSAIAAKANERRPRWHRLPYGVPLCIGFLAYLLLWRVQMPQPATAAPAAAPVEAVSNLPSVDSALTQIERRFGLTCRLALPGLKSDSLATTGRIEVFAVAQSK